MQRKNACCRIRRGGAEWEAAYVTVMGVLDVPYTNVLLVKQYYQLLQV